MDKKKSHYLVHGLFWKERMHNANYREARKSNLCSINKSFSDADLSKAQKEVFAYYQSLIDVLYDALGDTYTTDKQARIDLLTMNAHVEVLEPSSLRGKMKELLQEMLEKY